MPWNDVLVVAMFVEFIALIFTGFPVAWVLGGLPPLMGFLIYKVDPKMVAPLWEDPIGWIVLFFIALMEIVGVFMIRKILTVDV